MKDEKMKTWKEEGRREKGKMKTAARRGRKRVKVQSEEGKAKEKKEYWTDENV